jgi:hypothetical protein
VDEEGAGNVWVGDECQDTHPPVAAVALWRRSTLKTRLRSAAQSSRRGLGGDPFSSTGGRASGGRAPRTKAAPVSHRYSVDTRTNIGRAFCSRARSRNRRCLS